MLAKSISIIVPTFNRSYTIERCLNSILEQDYPDHKIEIIVVDDGSYDCTPSILTRYQHTNNIRVLRQKNKGVSSARNLGLKHARHSWIAFLDSDDYWMPKKLKYQMNLLTKEQRLVCHTQEIWIRNGKRVNQCKHHQKYGGYTFENNLPLCAMSPSSILIHRSIFESVGNFDEHLPACEDYDLWLRITAKFNVSYVSQPCIFKTGGHDDQLSTKHSAMDRFRIYALLKLIRGGTLNQKQIEQTKSTLQKKAQIYLKGCLKYSRPTESLLTELDEVLSNIDWIRFKEKVGLNDHSAMASYP